jgi:hypothetical protein
MSRTFWLEGIETVKGATTSKPDGITPGRRVRTPRQKGPSPQRLLELEKSEGSERPPILWPVKRPLREKWISWIDVDAISGKEYTVDGTEWQ